MLGSQKLMLHRTICNAYFVCTLSVKCETQLSLHNAVVTLCQSKGLTACRVSVCVSYVKLSQAMLHSNYDSDSIVC
jgi:hypothetical protein